MQANSSYLEQRFKISSKNSDSFDVIVKDFKTLQSYKENSEKMLECVLNKSQNYCTPDEIWLLEHEKVFTLGVAAKKEHILNQDISIPIIQTDRGGQVTYHGPGQLIVYFMINLKRANIGVRTLIDSMENSTIKLLLENNIISHTRKGMPGVYTGEINSDKNYKKIASLGLRIKKNCSYHGLGLNVTIDLTPFSWINPCGYKGLEMIRMIDLNKDISIEKVKQQLSRHLLRSLYEYID